METTARAILLNEREARILSLVGARLTEWDSGMTARVIVGESALAVYAVLPMDVMVALAVPAQVDEDAGASWFLSAFSPAACATVMACARSSNARNSGVALHSRYPADSQRNWSPPKSPGAFFSLMKSL